MRSVKEIQEQLVKLGFSPGPLDGMMGRNTQQAIKAFQIQRPPLQVDGIAGPQTIRELFRNGDVNPSTESVDVLLAMPWLDIAISKKGLREGKDNIELRKFLKSDGGTVGDPAQLPWCGDFVETCIALALPNEILPGNPYLARNWTKFGKHVEPTLGCVGVFWRGSQSGISGHVAFIVGKGPGVFYLLGGNQSNMVSVTSLSTTRLLDTRWPATVAMPKEFRLPTMKGGKLSINEA